MCYQNLALEIESPIIQDYPHLDPQLLKLAEHQDTIPNSSKCPKVNSSQLARR